MTLDIGLLLLGRFTAIAVVLMSAGAGFSMTLERLEEPVARLVARHGLIRAFGIIVRARRYRSGVSRFMAAVRVVTKGSGLVVGSSLLAVPAVMVFLLALLDGFTNPAAIPLDIGYILLLGALVYLVGPVGLYRVLVRLGKEPPRRGSWPPPIPRLPGAMLPSMHWDSSVRLYGYYLHGILVNIALWGSLFTLLNTLRDLPDDAFNEGLASLGYGLLFGGLAALEALLFTSVYWRFDRRTRAIGMIATFLDGPQKAKGELLIAVLGADPLGRNGRPSRKPTRRARDQLVNVVKAIETYSRVLQKRQRINVRHPAAHALELEAAHLRSYLAEPRSLDDVLPDDIRRSLERASAIIVGGTPVFVQATTARLARYEEQVETPSSTLSWVPRLSGALDVTGKGVEVGRTVLVAAALAYLLFAGQTSFTEILGGVTGLVDP